MFDRPVQSFIRCPFLCLYYPSIILTILVLQDVKFTGIVIPVELIDSSHMSICDVVEAIGHKFNPV
jgi:hypothetical protein